VEIGDARPFPQNDWLEQGLLEAAEIGVRPQFAPISADWSIATLIY
jgi:hypothetical protein